MLAACFARFPTAILAPDAVLGAPTALSRGYVRVIAGGLPFKRFVPRDMSKVVYTGNPVRPEVVAFHNAPYDTACGRRRVAPSGVRRQPRARVR